MCCTFVLYYVTVYMIHIHVLVYLDHIDRKTVDTLFWHYVYRCRPQTASQCSHNLCRRRQHTLRLKKKPERYTVCQSVNLGLSTPVQSHSMKTDFMVQYIFSFFSFSFIFKQIYANYNLVKCNFIICLPWIYTNMLLTIIIAHILLWTNW